MVYVSSACLRANKISDVIEEYAKYGIKYIELSGGTRFYPELDQDLIHLKEKYELEYACHAYFPPPRKDFVVNLASCNDEIYSMSMKHYEKCIQMLRRVGINTLSIHAGFQIEIQPNEIGKELGDGIVYDRANSYERFFKAYRHLDQLCADNHINFYLENNVLSRKNYENFGKRNYLMMTDSDSIECVEKQLKFDFLLDLAHLYVSSNSLNLNYDDECSKLFSKAKWIHLSENNGILDEHLPLKEKSDIWKQFLKRYRGDVNITLETNGNMDDIMLSIHQLKKLGIH